MKNLWLKPLLAIGLLVGLSAPSYAVTQTYQECTSGESGNGKAKLCANDRLYNAQYLRSPNGAYIMKVQSDGNLVIRSGSGAIWSSGTHGKGNSYLVMQGDNNLVMYNGSGPTWASGTHGTTGQGLISHIELTNDGNAVMYCKTGMALWSSKKGRLQNNCESCDLGTVDGFCANFRSEPTGELTQWFTTSEEVVVDYDDTWVTCNVGAPNCPTSTSTTGTSRCETTHVEAGFDYDLAVPLGALNITGGASKTYQVCNTESYSTACTPAGPGHKARAYRGFWQKDGVMKFVGQSGPYNLDANGNCAHGGQWVPPPLGLGALPGSCDKAPITVFVRGMWPEYANQSCQHAPL